MESVSVFSDKESFDANLASWSFLFFFFVVFEEEEEDEFMRN